jgi:hypothetical protein
MKRMLWILPLLLCLGGIVSADSLSGFAGICKSTGKLCPNQLPVAGTSTNTGTNTATLGCVKVGAGLQRAADGTLSPLYGTGAGTVAAGNDSRFAVTGATRALDNLTNPTAINQHLLPGTDIAYDLGQPDISFPYQPSLRFRHIYAQSIELTGGIASVGPVNASNIDSAGNTIGTAAGNVIKNTAITGATKTKITYDAKGLVTAGADATYADVGAEPAGAVNAAVSGTAGIVGAFTSTHVIVNSSSVNTQIGSDASHNTNIGQLSDATSWQGIAFNSATQPSTTNFQLGYQGTVGTAVNAPSGKTVFFNVGNTNYASVDSQGIHAPNLGRQAMSIMPITGPSSDTSDSGSWTTVLSTSWTPPTSGSIEVHGVVNVRDTNGYSCCVRLTLDGTQFGVNACSSGYGAGGTYVASVSPVGVAGTSASGHIVNLDLYGNGSQTCTVLTNTAYMVITQYCN